MEYITEIRGGYDEWSDEYMQIQGVRFDSGEEIQTRFIDSFTDQEGNPVEIELPPRPRIENNITVERYNPSYEYFEFQSLDDFEEVVDVEEKTVSLED